jgi:hypothetical protein
MPQHRPGYAPVAFDELLWQEDLERESGPGSDVAQRHRAEIEPHGQSMVGLIPVEQIGPIALPRCAKVYLPDSAGRWSMISQAGLDTQTDRFYFEGYATRQATPRNGACTSSPTTASTATRRGGRRADLPYRPPNGQVDSWRTIYRPRP